MSFPPAPSAPPTSVSTSNVTSSSISVQWGPVDCIHRNGDITGYSVRYGVVVNGSTQTMIASGGDSTEANITGLMPSTNYSIEVAAVNNVNTGVYSIPLSVITEGKPTCISEAEMSTKLWGCHDNPHVFALCTYMYL